MVTEEKRAISNAQETHIQWYHCYFQLEAITKSTENQ